MDYEKKQPTADCIVARLVPSWGSIVSLLFKATEPYEHYYDEHGEEVPYGAIVSWTDVELPPENEDERIRKVIIKLMKVPRKEIFEVEGITKESALAYLEKQKEQEPAEWSDNFEENIRNLLHEKLKWTSDDGSISSAVFIDDKTLKDIISGIWFYVGKEALKYPNKQLNVGQNSAEIAPNQFEGYSTDEPAEWSEEDEKMFESFMHKLEVCDLLSNKEIRWAKHHLKSLRPQLNIVSTENATEFGNLEYERGVKDGIQHSENHRWKPSEKQIDCLVVAASGYGNSEVADVLNSLINDLKKL